MRRRAFRNATFTSIVSSKGQLVLPVAVRERLGIKKGMRVNITLPGDGTDHAILEPLTARRIRELEGSFKSAGAALDYLRQERRRDRERGR